MGLAKIAIIALVFAVLSEDVFARRPSWIPRMQNGFKSMTPYTGPGNCANAHMDLAHIISWWQINQIIAACYNRQNLGTLEELADLVFEEDVEALYRIDFCSPGSLPINHTAQLRTKFHYNDHRGRRMQSDLRTLNGGYKAEVDNILSQNPFDWNNNTQRSRLERLLSNAPANLRYGHPTTNRRLRENLDPMGNGVIGNRRPWNNKLTDKEWRVTLWLLDRPAGVRLSAGLSYQDPQTRTLQLVSSTGGTDQARIPNNQNNHQVRVWIL